MGYELPSTPLWHVLARAPMTKNDLVKMTYANGSVLYVAKQRERWIADTDLLPKDLLQIRERYGVIEFEVVRCTERGLQSGYVGSSLVLEGNGSGEYAGKKIRCTSEPIVMDIAPAIRPLQSLDAEPAFTMSDDDSTAQ